MKYNAKKHDNGSSINLFKSFNDALEHIKKNEAKHLFIWINRYKTNKDMINSVSDKIYINGNYEMANIEQNKDIDSLLNNNPFNGNNVNAPLPFNKGDIICDSYYSFETYEFVGKTKNGIKVINNGIEEIMKNYLSLGYYDKNIAIIRIINYYKMKKV